MKFKAALQLLPGNKSNKLHCSEKMETTSILGITWRVQEFFVILVKFILIYLASWKYCSRANVDLLERNARAVA